jgi:glycine/D-amino acid oxidase-like deaminating enzyme
MNRSLDRSWRQGRRHFLGVTATTLLLHGCSRPSPSQDEGQADEVTPDLSDGQVQGFVACIRPSRRKTFRLEAETLGAAHVVHNYGHGGAGITVSHGCAAEALELVRKRVDPPAEVAVLGAGVIGLTSALRLLEAGYRVMVFARNYLPETASHKAGGQWCPSLIEVGESAAEKDRFARILRTSHADFRKRFGGEWGVFERPNYVEGFEAPSFGKVPEGVLQPAEKLARLPFRDVQVGGLVFRTLLIETPRYMKRLLQAVKDLKAELKEAAISSAEDVARLPQKVVVNCLGLGAGAVFKDELVVPKRGQLVLLKPQPLPYLLSHNNGYIFPRDDVLILGGTVETGVESLDPDREACRQILQKNRAFFGLA